MIDDHDAAVAGMAFLVAVLALLVMGIIVAERRHTRERLENRRELNQAHATMDATMGLDLEPTRGMDVKAAFERTETTKQLVWSHRGKPARKHRR